MLRKVISVASAADNELVAAKTGFKIRIIGYCIVAAGAVVATFKSGSTAISGAMTMATGTPQISPPANSMDGVSIMETAYGEALNLGLGGTVQVSGWLVYDVVA